MYLKLDCKQQGIGLPATVFLVVIFALIVLAMSELNRSSAIAFGQDINTTKAFYAAESGAQIALNRHFVGGTTCGTIDGSTINFTANGLQQCRANLACESVTVSSTEYFTFTSTATCGAGIEQATRSIQVRAHTPTGS